eukprot:3592229-Rhodomonas_salina.2
MTVHSEKQLVEPTNVLVSRFSKPPKVFHTPEASSRHASWIELPACCSARTVVMLIGSETWTGAANGEASGFASTTIEIERIACC